MLTATCHYLGWNDAPLGEAAKWLWGEYRGDCSNVTVALPGGRAGRRLLELLTGLAAESGEALQPPRILTAGQLTDELVVLPKPPAGRLSRTLAWDGALGRLSRRELLAIASRPPAAGDLVGRMRLAERLRTLHGELAAEGLTFGDVAGREGGFGEASWGDNRGEDRRWAALAAAQEHYRDLLAEGGCCDPHEGRRAAVEAGQLLDGGPVVLVGVVQQNAILRRLLEALGERLVVLVAAPASQAAGFDEFGALVKDHWRERQVGIDLERWVVADNPEDQARRTLAEMARWDGRYGAREISLGVCDGQLAPYLERRLAAEGVAARWAEGTPLGRTGPVLLLSSLGRFLERGNFAALAELARHPELSEMIWRGLDEELRGNLRETDGPMLLDAFYAEHLPGPVPLGAPDMAELDAWIPEGAGRRGAALAAWVRGLYAELGALTGREELALADWCAPLRALLVRLYGERGLRPATDEGDRGLAFALGRIGAALDTIEGVPEAMLSALGNRGGRETVKSGSRGAQNAAARGSAVIQGSPNAGAGDARASASELISLLLTELDGVFVPPAPEQAGVATVELLGWLELALDDAPALVVTGFNEGRVPAAVHGDAFLPEGLRRDLGLPDNDERLARDVYACELILNSREEAVFVSGRRSADSDPLTPSRILFHREAGEIPGRVKHFLSVKPCKDQTRDEESPVRDLPRHPVTPAADQPLVMAVTSFRKYLTSPYVYYLEQVLRLKTLDDSARELDPLHFGNLTHFVLEQFGLHGPTKETDERAIEDWLVRCTEQRAAFLYGSAPLPAVALQVRQLTWRLGHFARWQAQRVAAGWRIAHSEWQPAQWTPEPQLAKPAQWAEWPAGAVPFEVDGEPIALKGRIDRIDHHPDGRWALLDYKSGDTVKKPSEVHGGKKSDWKDLQLPLYTHLAQEITGSDELQLGYLAIGKSEDNIGLLEADWNAEQLSSALERAEAVVRSVRAGEFFVKGKAPRDEITRALLGEGLLSADAAEDEAIALAEEAAG